jgi:Flp pilus assembly protein TadD
MVEQTTTEAATSEQTDPPPETETGEEAVEDLAGLMVDLYQGETTMREAIPIDGPTWDYAVDQAYRLYANGNYERAEQVVRGLVSIDPSEFYANMLLGDILFQQGDGVSEYADDEVEDPETGTTYTPTRTEEAIRAFERAYEIDSDSEFVKTRLAELYMRDGWEEGAVELLEELSEEARDADTRQWAEAVLEVGR